MSSSKKFSVAVVAALVGMILGVVLTLIVTESLNLDTGQTASVEKRPLYWVAPMDPNYRRDGPGKSPMGMDLIPVYEDEAAGEGEGPGTITVSPDVVNNLGVRTTIVERKPLHTEIVTVGYVKYDEDKLIHIHPRVSGWVEKLYVKSTGDPVTEGAPLYALYSPELVNAQEEFVLALNRKNVRLIQAAEDRLNALQLSPRFIQALKRSLSITQTVTFYAPQSGVVDNLNIREGFFVQPGTTMLSIGALDPVWVEAEIFERQASLVNLNDPVTMTLDYLPGKTWRGQVDYVYPVLDSKTRTVRVRLRFDNPDEALKPNMFAQVTVHTDSDDSVLVIPREALIRTGRQDRVVLALGEGQFKSVAVNVGREDQTSAEIVEGLEAGERVVTSAQFLLDSESSKTSDFKRMHHEEDTVKSVWVGGTIEDVMPETRSVSATHDAIDEWDWPAMTMDFKLNPKVDIESLSPGTSLHMEITQLEGGGYEITGTHILDRDEAEVDVQSAKVSGVVNTVDKQLRMANISRGPILKWDRPATTMDFYIADSIDIDQLKPKAEVNFEFQIQGDAFVVTQLFSDDEVMQDEGETLSDPSEGDHSQEDHASHNSADRQHEGGDESHD